MRISDWSSDVCSSDLGEGAAADRYDLGAIAHQVHLHPPALAVVYGPVRKCVGVEIGVQLAVGPYQVVLVESLGHDFPEIGRASCRERVCQNGVVSVVAGVFNKK